MEPLDGNAIAGAMFEYFGNEMTTASGACAHCGTVTQIAELVVYSKAPSTVVRCPACGNVVFVVTEIRRSLQVSLSGFRLREEASPPVGA